jgi:hypothetical protein
MLFPEEVLQEDQVLVSDIIEEFLESAIYCILYSREVKYCCDKV